MWQYTVVLPWLLQGRSKSKVGDRSRRRPEGSIFNSYYTEVYGRVLLLSLDCSTLPSIGTLYCWVLSKEVLSSTIFFGMTRPGIEPWSPGPLANTLPISAPILFFQRDQVWFLCFNGISTLFRLFNAKAILLEEQ